MAQIVPIGYICSMNKKIRQAGILLHPTSLPSRYGIGDLGEVACRFVDFLASSGVGLWQILPLGPVGFGNSPYASRSAFAGSELLVSLEDLVDEGLLDLSEILNPPQFPLGFVDYTQVKRYKMPLLFTAAANFRANSSSSLQKAYEQFCQTEHKWLDDYALFRALSEQYGSVQWYKEWDKKLVNRDAAALKMWSEKLHIDIEKWKVLQFFFYRQWTHVKEYANKNQVQIIGDIPIFVAHDSVDAWTHSRFLKMNADGTTKASSGVPPDAYSDTGQLWGNPVYDWPALQADGFKWWIERLSHQLKQTDIVRIDHFRGFESYWEVPAGHPTAEFGSWVKAPGKELFALLKTHFSPLPVIAEDLGVITKEVEQLRDENHLPGMKVAHFAFEMLQPGVLNADHPYLPHNYPYVSVAYTGTHDNNTSKGWYEELDEGTKDLVRRYLSCSDEQVSWHLMRSVMASASQWAIIPMQDLLLLDSQARMNVPGTCGEPNWCWQLVDSQLEVWVSQRLTSLIQPFGRSSIAQKKSTLDI